MSYLQKVRVNWLSVLLMIVLLWNVECLSASQISQKCHCDITASFCDFSCCCDTDCGQSISESCFYKKSKYYCPNTDFFKSIKSNSLSSNVCYYYNTSSTITSELTISSIQRTQLVTMNKDIVPVLTTLDAGYKGYKLSSVFTIGGKSSFSFADASGNCLSVAGTSSFSFKFGQNLKISCICNGCGNSLLFADIMGKSISKFLGISSNDLNIPTVNDSSMTTLKLNFIIGKYGSQNVKYIERITHSYDSNGGNIQSLYVNFYDSDTIKQQQRSATFFPQIPIDMFYPIHIMS